jgi:hypothetical protein
MMVSVSALPEATLEFAKLKVELVALIPPTTTWTLGLAFKVTPLIAAVSVLAVPAVLLAVKVAV